MYITYIIYYYITSINLHIICLAPGHHLSQLMVYSEFLLSRNVWSDLRWSNTLWQERSPKWSEVPSSDCWCLSNCKSPLSELRSTEGSSQYTDLSKKFQETQRGRTLARWGNKQFHFKIFQGFTVHHGCVSLARCRWAKHIKGRFCSRACSSLLGTAAFLTVAKLLCTRGSAQLDICDACTTGANNLDEKHGRNKPYVECSDCLSILLQSHQDKLRKLQRGQLHSTARPWWIRTKGRWSSSLEQFFLTVQRFFEPMRMKSHSTYSTARALSPLCLGRSVERLPQTPLAVPFTKVEPVRERSPSKNDWPSANHINHLELEMAANVSTTGKVWWFPSSHVCLTSNGAILPRGCRAQPLKLTYYTQNDRKIDIVKDYYLKNRGKQQ